MADSSRQLAAMTAIASDALRHMIWQHLQLLKSTAKTSHISSSVFVGLLKEGFCTQDQTEDDGGAGDGDAKFQETEGTVSLYCTYHRHN